MTMHRRHLLTDVPWMAWIGGSAVAQPRSQMASSNVGQARGAVQVGAGTQAEVSNGAGGPRKPTPSAGRSGRESSTRACVASQRAVSAGGNDANEDRGR